ncbi:Protein of unknown function [Pyronema omphalodes CBS 100304]|uniref:Uncharacterized protein n=1 Tax=Pyronema omphalodes (strain CBS 100304) TaxID=1076935 RepID=U4L633_PYROM|nr:Protein of unknown function [Pyronema omphalodes CBS 100304]
MSNRRDPYGRQSKTEKESKETNSGQDTLLNPNMFNNIQGLDPNQPLYSTVQQPQAQAPTESTVLPTSLSNDGMAAQQLISESVAASSSGGPVHPSNSLFNRIKLPAEHKTQPVQSVLAFAAALPPHNHSLSLQL